MYSGISLNLIAAHGIVPALLGPGTKEAATPPVPPATFEGLIEINEYSTRYTVSIVPDLVRLLF